jgi:hypothetical protein
MQYGGGKVFQGLQLSMKALQFEFICGGYEPTKLDSYFNKKKKKLKFHLKIFYHFDTYYIIKKITIVSFSQVQVVMCFVN